MVEVDFRGHDWKLAGSCNEYDPELMWPVGTTGPALVQIAHAKSVCAACPIQAQCLEWAETNHEYYGIWGGLTEEERKEIRRTTKPGMLRKVAKKRTYVPAG